MRSHCAFERAENQRGVIGIFSKHIKADPVVFGELAMKEADDISHQAFGRKSRNGKSVEFGNEVGRLRVCGGHNRLVEHKWRRGAKGNGGKGDGRVKESGVAVRQIGNFMRGRRASELTHR